MFIMLKPYAKIVLQTLSGRQGEAVSIDDIALQSEINEATVRRHLKHLIACQLVRASRPNSHSKYTFYLMDGGWKELEDIERVS